MRKGPGNNGWQRATPRDPIVRGWLHPGPESEPTMQTTRNDIPDHENGNGALVDATQYNHRDYLAENKALYRFVKNGPPQTQTQATKTLVATERRWGPV